MICELVIWDENEKKLEICEILEKIEVEVLELRDVYLELIVTIESKVLEDFEVINLKVEELVVLGILGDMGIDFFNIRVDLVRRFLIVLF